MINDRYEHGMRKLVELFAFDRDMEEQQESDDDAEDALSNNGDGSEED